MITASHNPKQDNGFKLYWENGAQIIPPHDSGIATTILENLQPWQLYDVDTVRTHSQLHDVTEVVAEAYMVAIEQLAVRKSENIVSPLQIAYTGKYLRILREIES
jgi:phosphomannomutase